MSKTTRRVVAGRAAIILAAGKSTRMQSEKSKVLHEIGGLPMLAWVANLARSAGVDKIICVVGEANKDVRRAAENLGLEIALQEPQLGTGHAVQCAQAYLGDFNGDVAVLYADTPLIRSDTLSRVFCALEQDCHVAVMGFETETPAAYGRLIERDGQLVKIVEAKEASPAELSVKLCNSGVMAASAADMFSAVARVNNNNAKGEYYLTDVVEILRKDGKTAMAVHADEAEILGVNSRRDLAQAEQAFQAHMRSKFMDAGVTLRDPDSIYFSWDTQVEPEAEIGANVVFGPGCYVASGAVIHPFCHIEGATIGKNTQIGPFARLRPGAHMCENSKAGNFVEIKKSVIGKGSKINHLSYIGDAEIGEGVNVGAGTITCNYDGYAKHKTIIGDGAFIGTNSSLVAPLTIGAGAYLGSGGVITENVPDDALALGRAKQANKEGWAKRYRDAQDRRSKKRKLAGGKT